MGGAKDGPLRRPSDLRGAHLKLRDRFVNRMEQCRPGRAVRMRCDIRPFDLSGHLREAEGRTA
jgi:hypothetical protein